MTTAAGEGKGAVLRAMDRLLSAAGVAATSCWVEREGRRIHYLEAGSGSPVILIHGAGGGSANWFGVIGPLSRRFRVLAPDLPGFGLSDPIEAEPPLGVQVAGLVADWLSAIGVERCAIAGTSFGGLVTLRLAQQLGNRITRFALIDSAGLGTEMPRVIRAVAVRVLGALLLRPSRSGTYIQLRRLLTAGRPLDPAIEPALLEYLLQSARAADTAILARAYRMFCGFRGQREVLGDDELSTLRQPALVLWGRRDAFFPPMHAERAARRLPNARLKWIESAGHSPNWEAPAEVSATLCDFFGCGGDSA